MTIHLPLVALLLAALAPARPAPAAPANLGTRADTARIAGFASVPWGTPLSRILAARGNPVYRQTSAENVTVVSYDDRVAGQKVAAMFYVHPRHGLFRGGYAAPFSSVAECSTIVALLEAGVARRYPDIEPVASGGGEGDNPCSTFVAGESGYAKLCMDEATGARVYMLLAPGSDMILLVYSTPQADEWERRKSQSQF